MVIDRMTRGQVRQPTIAITGDYLIDFPDLLYLRCPVDMRRRIWREETVLSLCCAFGENSFTPIRLSVQRGLATTSLPPFCFVIHPK